MRWRSTATRWASRSRPISRSTRRSAGSLRIPGAETGVTLFTPPGHENRVGTFHALSFWTDDVDATVAELKARGVTFERDVERAEWGRFAIFADPDVNRFVLGSR